MEKQTDQRKCQHGGIIRWQRGDCENKNVDTSKSLLWKIIYDSFGEKGILKTIELFH